jgi:hypothetical protein
MSEYIKKSIETDFGANAECWIVNNIYIDLKNNSAHITLDGYKDFNAYKDGKFSMGKRDINIEGIELLKVYLSVHDIVVSSILANEKFQGGNLEIVEA